MYQQEITRLALAIREAVTSHKRDHPAIVSKNIWVRRRDTTLKYSKDINFANFPSERFEKENWDWRDHQAFHASVITTLQGYKELFSPVGPTLERFARVVAHASFLGLADTELAEMVTVLERQIDRLTLPVRVTGFISGLDLDVSPLVISDHLRLRQPTADDVTQMVLIDDYGDRSLSMRETWFTIIGEFTIDAMNTGPAQVQFVRAIEALRLFRVGGVVACRYSMSSRHAFVPDGAILSSLPQFSRFSYSLSSSDVDLLSAFLSDVPRLMPDPFQLEAVTNEKDIAYVRYRDALFQAGLLGASSHPRLCPLRHYSCRTSPN